MKIFPLCLSAALLLLLTATAPAQPSAALADERDGKSYRIVKIGEQSWMAENLNYEAEGSACYENKPENCEKYGRRYDWETAKKVCPKGWHLPSSEEWDILVDFAGGEDVAGKYLKAKSGWEDKGKSGNGEDKFGFAAMPAGSGYICNWWSATERDAVSAYYRSMVYRNEDTFRHYDDKSYLFSVRCAEN